MLNLQRNDEEIIKWDDMTDREKQIVLYLELLAAEKDKTILAYKLISFIYSISIGVLILNQIWNFLATQYNMLGIG